MRTTPPTPDSTTYNTRTGTKLLGQGESLVGSLIGGRVRDIAYRAERGGNILSERFEGKSPEWQKEHENAFERAQNEAQQHFHRCHSCHQYVCDACFNEDEGLCTNCAPRQEVYVAKARAEAMRRNIDAAGESATVWKGEIESKTTVCPFCGKILQQLRRIHGTEALPAMRGEKRPDREILQQLRKQSGRCRPAVRPLPVLWDRQSARHQILRKLRHQAVTKPIHTRG